MTMEEQLALEKEQQEIEEEHAVWRTNAQVLYDYQKSYSLEWPSLTIQWLPGVKDHPNRSDYCLQSLIFGTHTIDNEPNYLLIADVSLPLPDTVVDNRTKDENGEPIKLKSEISKVPMHPDKEIK